MAKVTRGNPAVFKTIVSKLQELDGLQSQAGWFASSKYEDGTPVAYVATIQEFGYAPKKIPPRPFMRPAVSKNKLKWMELMQIGAKAILRDKIKPFDVMDAVADMAAADIAYAIRMVTTPILSERTRKARLARKSSKKPSTTLYKPLIDTGYMFATITHLTEREQ